MDAPVLADALPELATADAAILDIHGHQWQVEAGNVAGKAEQEVEISSDPESRVERAVTFEQRAVMQEARVAEADPTRQLRIRP